MPPPRLTAMKNEEVAVGQRPRLGDPQERWLYADTAIAGPDALQEPTWHRTSRGAAGVRHETVDVGHPQPPKSMQERALPVPVIKFCVPPPPADSVQMR